jgi:hypothetical protein
MKRHCVYRYHAMGPAHPPCELSIMRDENSALTVNITDRHVASIELPLAEFRKLVDACRDEELVQMVGALIHGKEPAAEAAPKNITINGAPHRVTNGMLGYKDILWLANQPDGATVVWWVNNRGDRGSLIRGQMIPVLDGMHIDAVMTNSA